MRTEVKKLRMMEGREGRGRGRLNEEVEQGIKRKKNNCGRKFSARATAEKTERGLRKMLDPAGSTEREKQMKGNCCKSRKRECIKHFLPYALNWL